MLSVDHDELIRRKHLIDGLSIRAISRELGHSRKTIRKALAHGTPPGYRRHQPVASPVMDKVAGIVDAWCEQDKTRPPKQRHTAQRVYERLRDEHGFTGSASAVRRYVSKLKTTGQEVFMPLQFDPGKEAQVDPRGWHTGWIIGNGVQRRVRFFCLRIALSKPSAMGNRTVVPNPHRSRKINARWQIGVDQFNKYRGFRQGRSDPIYFLLDHFQAALPSSGVTNNLAITLQSTYDMNMPRGSAAHGTI